MTDRSRIPALPIPLAAMAAAAFTASAYWPGLMSWDPVRQYGEALSGDIDDWHPPAMQWVWRQLIGVHAGPLPMLLLQLALYWGGLTLLAATMARRGRPGLGWALLACGLWPFGLALTGMILKDSLMAGTLLVATALLVLRGTRGGAATGLFAAACLIFAATLRFNAFTACLPLLVALLPRAWWRTWPRMLASGILATALLMAAMPVANRLIGAKPSGVELSLVIFDLGGITRHARVNAFPEDIAVPNAVAANDRCYKPAKWDSYSDWVEPECPLGYTAWNDDVDPHEVHPYAFWLRAIAAHPFAWAGHRLNHFAINTRILPLADAIERPVPYKDAPNPWGFSVTPNAASRTIDALALATAHAPLGWPIVWIGLAIGALIAGLRLPSARLIVPIALSSALYGLGYLVFSVASELRYHLWTELAALLAAVLVLGDPGVDRRRIVRLFGPALIGVAAGIAGRTIG